MRGGWPDLWYGKLRKWPILERFRMSEGCYPEGLDDLVPGYLEKLPADPCSESAGAFG